MDPDVAELAKRSIKERDQRNPVMGGNRGFQGIQYGRGQNPQPQRAPCLQISVLS